MVSGGVQEPLLPEARVQLQQELLLPRERLEQHVGA